MSDTETKMNALKTPTWKAILIAGVTASLVFQLLEIIFIPLSGGGSPWGPARMIAAIVLGEDVLPPPATFDLFIVAVAFTIDIVLAIIYTAVLSRLIRRVELKTALVVAALFGAGLYVINFYGFAQLFPWFEMGRNLVTLLIHIIFSMTAVWAYKNQVKASR